MRLFRRRTPPSFVSCPVCWCSVLEAHYEVHWRWHDRMGHIDPDGAQTNG
jgi:hypothetical protein